VGPGREAENALLSAGRSDESCSRRVWLWGRAHCKRKRVVWPK